MVISVLIYILDRNKITKYSLPNIVEDVFVIKYYSEDKNEEILININYQDNEWIIRSNGSVNIIENNIWTSKKLELHTLIKLTINGVSDDVYLYCSPIVETEYLYMPLDNNNKNIKIGNDDKCDIIFKSNNVFEEHAEIIRNDNGYYIFSLNASPIYLNRQKIDKGFLRIGDIIFINGLKITFMGSFLKVNNPLNKVTLKNVLAQYNLPTRDNTKYQKPTISEQNVNLYNDSDYFFHTPYLKNILEMESVEIDAPPNPINTEDVPFLLSFGSSLTMIAYSVINAYNITDGLISGEKSLVESIPGILICTAMLIGSVVVPRLMKNYQKKRAKKREILRQNKYTEYLNEKSSEIKMILSNQTQTLKFNYLSSEECYRQIINKSKSLWQREITDNDFLTLRIGIGSIDAKLEIVAPQKHFTLDDDNLRTKVYELVENSKKLNDVPITFNLIKNNISAIVNSKGIDYDFLQNMIVQLITYHSSGDLKLVFLVHESKEEYWKYVKYLPHCWSDDKQIRFFATNSDDMKTISNYLLGEYNERLEKANSPNSDINKNEEYKDFLPYYLIITDNCKATKDLQIITNLLNKNINLGFSILFADSTLKNLPNDCNSFLMLDNDGGVIMEKELSSQNQIKFNIEKKVEFDMELVSQILGNIPVLPRFGDTELPTSISFLEMYKVGKIEQLNILNRWQTNNPVVSLKAPIGVNKTKDVFILDLHEKYHGPHGLIAGSTGSGKSEFIITYILSLAINYHPNEVQFVLIDYKGGGIAGAFENRQTVVRLPHLVGTITNLDTSEMNRTLVSIESELKRRQIKFNQVRDLLGESTIDIYKYQKLYREGKITEPISHLFIISDEFAELKKQQPEFMNQLISIARIGRSLGIHLILATQKPSGVVNDQIWSNSKFKICLKVQDRSDSMEVLKKPDAASIKEVGRFYLQVGYDEYFEIGQSGWAGAKYNPTDYVVEKIDDSIDFVNNIGYSIKTINNNMDNTQVENSGDQLTNIVRYIINLSQKNNIVTQKLWLDSIPENIYLFDLIKKYNYQSKAYYINPVIGEYDIPNMQSQRLLTIDLTNGGNTLIYGMTGSGKENLLLTLIYSVSICNTPQEVNFYICDFGSESLKVLRKIPHVGDILLIDDSEKLIKLFNIVSSEIERRKDLFADYSGSYVEYIKSSGNKEPLMVIVINNYEVFTETYSRISDLIYPFIRDGYKYGVIFIITSITINSIRSRLAQNFNNKIALKLPNDSDYREVLNSPRGLYPADKFGRGLVKIDKNAYEFQTAFICEKDNINAEIKNISAKLIEKYNNYKAPKIPILPNIVTVDMIFNETEGINGLPLGIEKETLETYIWDFLLNPVTLISAVDIDQHIYFMNAILRELAMTKDIKIKIIDVIKYFKSIYSGMYYYSDNFDSLLKEMLRELTNEKYNNYKTIYIITGIGKLKEKLDNYGKEYYTKIFDNINIYQNSRFIFVDNQDSYKNLQIEPWYRSHVDNTYGIWLGQDVGIQSIINVKNIDLNDKKLLFPYMAFAIYKGRYMILKYVVEGVKVNNEE